MCGIAGLFDLRGRRPLDPARVERMTAALAHRGPDGSGFHHEPGLSLGHRRLSIVDLAGGGQPMANEDGTVLTTYNGEIYNHEALRRELADGHRFETRCDTEVLVHGWEEWGESLPTRLRGMFAFAIWDRAADSLFLSRDRVGERPLYYAVTPDGLLVFASELRAVVVGLGGAPSLDNSAVADYFAYGYVPDPKSIFAGICKLEPGYSLTLRRGQAGRPEPRAYWNICFDPSAADGVDRREELVERLTESVALRRMSDVPLGSFLSGGVDSSGIVALMAGLSDAPVQTSTIGFDDPAVDERPFARLVAERYGTDHLERTVAVDSCAMIETLAKAYGEPFADSSALPTYLVSRLARERVTVAMSGDGGDELFAGYRRYWFFLMQERLRRHLPEGLRRGLFAPLARHYPKLDRAPQWLRGKSTFESLAQDSVTGYFRSVTVLPDSERRRLLTADFQQSLGDYRPESVLARHAERAGTDDPLGLAQYLDFKTWLPGRMLVKVDRASMAHGLEVRPPLLDHELAEWAAGLPLADRMANREGKILVKRAFEPLVPAELLYRRKQGFSLPLAKWMQRGLAGRLDTLVGSGRLAETGIIDPDGLQAVVREHRSGARDHSQAIWSLLMFDAFLAQDWAAAGEAAQAPGPADLAPPIRTAEPTAVRL
ncbi:MAG: XrtA/PEP-CTERM system amidotransferase [Tistlia sp.]|uniref:XrtA/PEP-CTERM system amidotransferase n=1 Tax=Tistlia sp. TaxID=3057121 RepID=UPI0034A39A42